MEERSLDSAAVPWEEPAGGPRGLKRKILRTGADGRPRVALVRLGAGFEMEAHQHAQAENHFVIEGMYESHGEEYSRGAYRYIPRNKPHGPTRSRAGALILVTWED